MNHSQSVLDNDTLEFDFLTDVADPTTYPIQVALLSEVELQPGDSDFHDGSWSADGLVLFDAGPATNPYPAGVYRPWFNFAGKVFPGTGRAIFY